MKRNVVMALSIWLVVTLVAPMAQAAVTSTFDNGDDGWRVVDVRNFPNPPSNPPEVLNFFTPTFNSSGGNPGGFISMTDPSGNWFLFDAPAPFLGNQSSAFGGSLTYDMQVTASDGVVGPAVMLVGQNTTLYFRKAPPTSAWTAFDIPLTPGGWLVNDPVAGAQATELEMQQVLGNLVALRISGDWLDGTETAGLDNVVLSPSSVGPPVIPAPGAILLGTLGASLVGWLRRRGMR